MDDGSDQDDGKDGPEKGKDAISADDKEFDGDLTLMRSSLFMYEAIVSKEVARAVAEGDVGRVYEGIKVRCQLNPMSVFSWNVAHAVHVCGLLTQQVHRLSARHDCLLGN